MATYSRGAPGFSLERFFTEIAPSKLHSFVPAHVWRLAEAINPDLTGARAPAFVAQAVDPVHLLSNDATRREVLSLLPLEKAAELAGRLDGTAEGGNPYKTLLALDFGPEEIRQLYSFFGVGPIERLGAPQEPAHQVCESRYGLFPHQRKLVGKVEQSLLGHPRRLLLHMPTGSGKTRTAMNIVSRRLTAVEPQLVIWLAQSGELLEQAAQEFSRAWGHLGNRPLSLFRMWGSYSPHVEEARDGLLVAGFAKLYAASQRDPNMILQLGDAASLVVVDEAHQAIAPTYRELIDTLQLKRPGNALLGLSATPGRTWNDVSADAELAEFFGGVKVTLEIEGYADPVQFLVDEGYLARATFKTLVSESEVAFSPESDFQEIPDEVLERLGDDEKRNIQIISVAEDLFARHSRIILFAASVNHARLISTLLNLKGYDSAVITANTDSFARETIIRRFRTNDNSKRIICNYGVLTTGFDAPKTSAAIIARPTRSLVLFSQMVGRAIRGPRAGGNATCEIVTVVDPHLPGFGSVAEAFGNWEDVWK